ncbi:MAG: FHA domain-containing protein [Bryobacteraceae bacterium]
MPPSPQISGEARLNGESIVEQLIRNMELGRFEMAYTVLFPCVFDVYLHPEDHARLGGIFGLIIEDAKRALAARVTKLNTAPTVLGLKRPGRQRKEYKIANNEWVIDFFPDMVGTVPLGDIEIHSELNVTAQPGFRGTKTTLMDREPSVTSVRPPEARQTQKLGSKVLAEIRYEDDTGPQVYRVMQNHVRAGRGGADVPMDLALYSNDEVSREHLVIRRDAATGQFYVMDKSTNGTWLDGKRLKKDVEAPLAAKAEIGVGEVLKLLFEVTR